MGNGLIDFTDCPMSNKHGLYGGATGQKFGIVYNDKDWILKFPRKVGRAPYPLFPIETGFNVLSEYLGTHSYGYLGFPVPETLLGTYEGTDDPDDSFIRKETMRIKSAFLERVGEDENGRVIGRYIYPFRFIMDG